MRGEIFRRDVEGPRGVRLLLRDVDAADPGAIHADVGNEVAAFIGNGDVHTTMVGTGREALTALAGQKFDCMVLDLGLPDMSGMELLEEVKKRTDGRKLPVIIYTARDLMEDEAQKLKRLAESSTVEEDDDAAKDTDEEPTDSTIVSSSRKAAAEPAA